MGLLLSLLIFKISNKYTFDCLNRCFSESSIWSKQVHPNTLGNENNDLLGYNYMRKNITLRIHYWRFIEMCKILIIVENQSKTTKEETTQETQIYVEKP